MSRDGEGRGLQAVLGALRDRGLIPDPLHAKIASLLGVAVALSAGAASAAPPPRHSAGSPLPPWSRTIGHPPPRPIDPTGGAHPSQPEDGVPPVEPPAAQVTSSNTGSDPDVPEGETIELAPVEPAHPLAPVSRGESRGAHLPRPAPRERLFPRAIGDPGRERAMRAHPAGGNLTHVGPTPGAGRRVTPQSPKPPSPPASGSGNGAILAEVLAAAGASRGSSADERYTVRPGDSLWDIAEMKLGTAEAGRIARYWPRIHRANRDIIGGDPNHIVPGQVLTLPPERP